jgi:putative membrane protein
MLVPLMIYVVWSSVLLGALVHVLVFAWEALLIRHPRVHQGIFSVPTAEVPAIRLWAFGVGFYNLFLATGAVTGVVAWARGSVTIGATLVVYVCVFWLLSSLVLLVADRLAMGRPRGKGLGGVVGQGLPALVALAALAAL